MTNNHHIDRIKDLLNEWAGWNIDRCGTGYPRQVSFAKERVQCDAGSSGHREMPDDVKRINEEIERFAPGFKRIINLEYMHKGPQKTKAAILKIPRQVYCARLSWIYEQLVFAMWGVEMKEAA